MVFKYHTLHNIIIGISLCFVVFYVLITSHVSAQGLVGGLNTSLGVSPRFPSPYGHVDVTLNSYALDTTGASIVWYVDGIRLSESDNERSISFIAGPLGKKQTIKALITQQSGYQTSVSESITPTAVDLILESDTYVHPFYPGRSLPSENSKVRAIAIVNTGLADDPATFTYDWKLNNSSLLGGPVKGKRVADFEMPRYLGGRVTVEVYNAVGKLIGSAQASLNPTSPILLFYEDNPLRGMGQKALGKEFTLLGDETTVRAIPYFMDTNLSPQETSFSWRLNGVPVDGDFQPDRITLRKTGVGGGVARVELELILKRAIPQFVTDSFVVNFR